MLPAMTEKVRIAIVGAGNLGTALAVSLRGAGYVIESVIPGRTRSSLQRGKALAREVGARLRTDLQGSSAAVVWFCVPDSKIMNAAAAYARHLPIREGLVALHSSGALTSDELESFRHKGAAVASAHPLMTFVRDSWPSLAGVPFAVEGDAPAIRLVRRIVTDLGGAYYPIRKKDKAAYHAWGAFASPLLTSLLVTSERVAELAGVDRKSARRRMIPILLQTLANYASLGAAGAFSGPIVRGDVETVRKHLEVLRRTPTSRNAYTALARAALESLPANNKNALRMLLLSRKK